MFTPIFSLAWNLPGTIAFHLIDIQGIFMLKKLLTVSVMSLLASACDNRAVEPTAAETPSTSSSARTALLPQGSATCIPQGDKCIVGGDAYVDLSSTVEPSSLQGAARSEATVPNGYAIWPSNTVYYRFVTATPAQIAVIRAQMDVWQNATGVKFVESTRLVYCLAIMVNINSTTSIGGSTSLGYQQNSSMSLNDISPSTVIHELGHVLGLTHEHERSDRDLYVKVNTANVSTESSCQSYYLNDYPNAWGSGIGGFDYSSVMIYESYGCAKPNKAVLTKLDGSIIPINSIPTASDINGVKRLYTSTPFTGSWLIGGNYTITSAIANTFYAPSFSAPMAVAGEMNGLSGADLAVYSDAIPGY